MAYFYGYHDGKGYQYISTKSDSEKLTLEKGPSKQVNTFSNEL